ncbi:MAG TPA: hypothetical protein VJ873_10305, partial [bacterium]|nr:hypothetical protein [bacterium]
MAKFFGRVLLSPVLLFLLSPFSSLWACTPITVNVTTAAGDTSAGSLGDAINQINANGTCGGTIDLSAIAGQTVNMSGDYAFVTQSVTILGNNVILNGQNAYQGLSLGGGVSSVSGMSVSIANLSF